MIKKFLYSLILVVVAILLIAMPVLAIDDPDSPLSVNAVYVYEDLLEVGDRGVLIDYYIDYDLDPVAPPNPPAVTAIPDETVTEAYLAIFVDDDFVTQLKAVAPYTFVYSGYGRGIVWIYFTAAEAAVGAFDLDSANVALYRIWLAGNPTLAWAGAPPLTVAGIDQWSITGDSNILLALRILYYADLLELAWGEDLIGTTPLGNRLTTDGESYFESAIPNLRLMAPAAFAIGTLYPAPQNIDYSTSFGAVAESGTATLTVSPDTLTAGGDTIDTGITIGTVIITLEQGTVGTITDLGGNLATSPDDLVPGVNTVTVTGAGTFTVDVNLENTTTGIEAEVIGTAFDLTDVAADFGMTRWMFSGLVWLAATILICAAVYGGSRRNLGGFGSANSGKLVMLIFNICIVGGGVLGLMHPLVAVLMFIGFGGFTFYIIFFRGANI